MCVHHLESEVARWPRVVVGEGVVRAWNRVQSTSPQLFDDAMNITFARIQKELVFVDTDGQLAVDYLGSKMLELIGDDFEDLPAIIDAAHVEVERQLVQHSANEKIRKKLESAGAYFDSRVGRLTDSRRRRAEPFAEIPPRRPNRRQHDEKVG